jgi:hypothetical protein
MRRHDLDPVSLTSGFAFTGLGLLFLLNHADQALRLHWVLPLLLLALGIGILVDLARHRDPAEGPAPEPVPTRDPDVVDGDPEVRPTDGDPEVRPTDGDPEVTADLGPTPAPVDSREHPN